jgi:hypothetical protein
MLRETPQGPRGASLVKVSCATTLEGLDCYQMLTVKKAANVLLDPVLGYLNKHLWGDKRNVRLALVPQSLEELD